MSTAGTNESSTVETMAMPPEPTRTPERPGLFARIRYALGWSAFFGLLVVAVLQSPVGGVAVVRSAIALFEPDHLDVRVGGAGWTTLTSPTLRDVEVRDEAGVRIFAAERLDARVSILSLLRGSLRLPVVHLDSPDLVLLPRAGRDVDDDSRAGADRSPPPTVLVDEFTISRGRMVVLTTMPTTVRGWSDTAVVVDGLDGTASLLRLRGAEVHGEFGVSTAHLRLGVAQPEYTVTLEGDGRLLGIEMSVDSAVAHGSDTRMSGSATVSWTAAGESATVRLDGRVTSASVSPADVRAFVPPWQGEESFAVVAEWSGVADSVRVDVGVEGSPGRGGVDGTVWARLDERGGVAWDLVTGGLDLVMVGLQTDGESRFAGRSWADLSGAIPEEWVGTVSFRVDEASLGALKATSGGIEGRFEAGDVDLGGELALEWPGASAILHSTGTASLGRPQPTARLSGGISRLTVSGQPPTSVSYTLEATGLTLDDLELEADARLAGRPLQIGETAVSAADAQLRLRDRRGEWAVGLDGAAGEVRARGALVVDSSRTTVSADEIRWGDVDIMRLLGDSTPSRWAGRGNANVTWSEGALESADLRLASGAFESATATVDSAWAEATWTRTGGVGDFRLRSGPGSIHGRVALQMAEVPFVEFEEVILDKLDVVRLLPVDSPLTTRIDAVASGRWPLAAQPAGGQVDVRVLASEVGRADSVQGVLEVAADDGVVAINGRLDSTVGAVSGNGVVDLTQERVSWRVPLVEIDSLDVAAVAGQTSSSLVSGRIQAEGRTSAPDSLTALASADFDTIAFGPFGAAAAKLDAKLQGTSVALLASAESGGTTLRGSGSLDLHAEGEYDATVFAVSPPADATPADTTVRLVLSGQGFEPTLANARLRIDVDTTTLFGEPLHEAVVRARIAGGEMELDTLRLVAAGLRVAGRGTVPLAEGREHAWEVDAQLSTFESVRPWVAARPLAIGEGFARASGAGEFADASISLETSANAVAVADVQIVGLSSTASTRLSGWRMTSATGSVTAAGIRSPALDVEDMELQTEYAQDEWAISMGAVAAEGRELGLDARIDPRPERRSLNLDRLDLSLDGDEWTLARPVRVIAGDTLTVDSLELSTAGQYVRVDGRVHPDGSHRLHLALDSVRYGTVADLLGFHGLDGRVTATVMSEGTASNPSLGIDGSLTLVSPHAPEATVSLVADVQDDNASIEAVVRLAGRSEPSGALQVRGGVPLDLDLPLAGQAPRVALLDAPLDLSVTADSLTLAWLRPIADPLGFTELTGTVDGSLALTGTVGAPGTAGTLQLSRGSVGLPSLGTRWEAASATLDLADSRSSVVASARSGGGSLSLSGDLTLEELTPGDFDIEVEANAFEVVDNRLARAVASGNATIRGTLFQPDLEGQITLLSTDLYLGNIGSPTSTDVVLTAEDYAELEAKFGRSFERQARTRSPFFDSLSVEIEIEMGRDTWVRQGANPRMAVQLNGEVAVSKPRAGDLGLLGSIEAVPGRSTVEQFGRRFIIERGEVRFAGPVDQTDVDVLATYSIPSIREPDQAEVTIELGLTGRADDFAITLGSDPAMENSDIVSYLATGRPAASDLGLSESGGFTSVGTDLALGGLTTALENAAAESVGLDVVDIETDGLRGGVLVAGRYVSPRIFVGFRQPLALGGDGSRTDASTRATSVEVELQALRWLLLNLEAGGGALDLLFRTRHAY